MSEHTTIALNEIIAKKCGSVNPLKYPDEVFDLYSIPAFDCLEPEVLKGSEIGSTKQIVQPGDVILSKIIPHIRRAWIVGKNRGRRIIASGEWIVFRGKQVDASYLRHILVGDPFHAEFMRTVSGVGGSLLRARPEYVGKIKILLPPIAEQKRIAAMLDKAEELRELRRQALRKLDVIAQSIFIEMFGDPQVSSNIYSMEMNDLVTKFIDYRGKSPEKSETGIPLITAKIVKEKEVKEPNEFIPADSYDAWMRRGIPSPGDVIITTEAPMGEVALVPDYKAAFAQRLLVLQPNRNKVDSIYLMWALTMPFVIRQLQQQSTGSTVTGIRSKEFKQISLPLPPIPLQQEFARRIEVIEQLKTTHRESLAHLDDLFASLQHRAFRGEIRL